MAIFKAIVNTRTGKAIGRRSPKRLEDYLKYETDDWGHVVRDEKGDPIPRDAIVSALNADGDNFALSCREIFAQYHVNQRRDSLQYKHYVQGFHPEDSERMDRETCHRLGEELARTVWKDFPVLVVTHFDQETEDGEYHWHNHFVVGNCNVHTGEKLCTTGAAMWGQKRFVAAQADAVGLVRKGLILQDGRILESKQGDRITSAEYQVAKRLKKQAKEQVRKQNALTQKAELRLAIRAAASQTTSFEEFRRYLKDVYNVETKETRGVISYLHPDRMDLGRGRGVGWIRGRSLGKSYEKEAIIDAYYEQHDREIHRGRSDGANTGAADTVAAGTNRSRAEDGNAVGTDLHAAVGTAERVEELVALYRELFAEAGGDEREAGRIGEAAGRDERPADELKPGGTPNVSDGVRSGRGKQV